MLAGCVQVVEVRELLLETPGRVATIPHPGVSALKKEHGILQSRPNISDIGKGSRLQYLCIQYVRTQRREVV